jgi:hypothetical protein
MMACQKSLTAIVAALSEKTNLSGADLAAIMSGK